VGRSIPRLRLYVSTSDQSRSDAPPLPAARPNHLRLASMTTWEITITCRDGSRLRLSERRDHAPLEGAIFDTADTGQIIKARIDACREEKPNGWGNPFFHVTAIEI
jgi:hypothetical protein